MISSSERRALRARAHPLKPVVLLGQQGLTPAVFAAIDEALTAHELIKVRLRGIERESREAAITEIASRTAAEVINLIGHILTLHRANPEPVAVPAPAQRKKKTGAGSRSGGRANASRSPYEVRESRPLARRRNARAPTRSSPTRRGPK
jgi:RNA-binding protein